MVLAVRQAVIHFLHALDASIEEAVSDYVAATLEENTVENVDMEELQEMLQGFLPAFAALPGEQQHAQLWTLLRQVERLRSEADSVKVSTDFTDAATINACNLKEQFASLSTTCLDTQAGPQAPSRGAAQPAESIASAAPVASCSACRASSTELDLLAQLVPSLVSRAFLQHVLQYESSVERAAQWLVECDDVQRQEQQWQRAQQAARERTEAAERAEQAARKTLLAKYMLQADSTAVPPKKKAAPLTAWTSDDSNHSRKARYRDGKLVTTKGDKFVVEDLGKSWDGGSSGKVITKGKRGQGFV